jgi:hypothetical protein
MKKIHLSSKMLKSIHLLFLVNMIIFSGCHKDEEGAGPAQNNDPGKLLLTETIGIKGGSIETDSFMLVIPPGTFTADYKLEVFVSGVEQPFKSIAVTRLYKIKGLPPDFTDSLYIRLKCNGPLTDESYICQGFHYYYELLDSTFITYSLLDCKDSAGYLMGYFHRCTDQNILKSTYYKNSLQSEPPLVSLTLGFMGWHCYQSFESPIYNVLIEHPTTLDPGFIQRFSVYLEDIYRLFLTTGFNEVNFPKYLLPDKVMFFDEREFNGNSYMELLSLDNDLSVYLEREESDSMPGLRSWAVSIIFRGFLKYIYENSTGFYSKEYDWFDGGAEMWLRRRIVEEKSIKENIGCIFNGLQECNYESEVIIPYLIGINGESVLIKVYQEIQKGTNALTAISSIIQKPVNDWFSDFFKNYLEGKVCNISGVDFNEKVFQDPTITYKQDFPVLNVPTNMINEYNDLSARIFYFNTDDDRINESSYVFLKADYLDVSNDDLKLLVFTYKRATHEIKFIIEGTEINILDLKKFKDNGTDLLVMVVNSYFTPEGESQNNSNIKLTVEFKDVERLNISKCSIWLFNADVRYRYDDNSEFSITESFNFTNDNKVDGDLKYLNDSTLKAEWDFTAADTRYWGDVMLIIDQESYFISSIESNRNERTINEEKNWNWKKEYYISCKNIQLDTENLNFKVEKDDLFNNLEVFEHRQEWYTESDLSYAREVEDISTNTESYLSIEFY